MHTVQKKKKYIVHVGILYILLLNAIIMSSIIIYYYLKFCYT